MNLAQIIKPYDFAKRGYSFSGESSLGQHQQKFSEKTPENTAFYTDFKLTLKNEIPMISGRIKANIPMTCQRCLQPTTIALEHSFSAAFVRQGDEISNDENIDEIYYENDVDSIDFLTNELLLAMPITVKHQDCNIAYDNKPMMTNKKPHQAFKILNTLKQGEI